MNGPFVVAQAQSAPANAASPVQVIKITKPAAGQSEVFHASFTGTVKVDFTAIANEQITLYHDNTDQTLHIIFADGSQAIIQPFFDSSGVLSNIVVGVGQDQDLTGAQFAAQFPITVDQSVLPAAGTGGAATASGADFHDPSVDPLSTPTPLSLLPAEELPPIQFHNIEPAALFSQAPNSLPTIEVLPDRPDASGNSEASEAGLPTRGLEPAGSGEIADGNGTNNSDPSETATGSLNITTGGDTIGHLYVTDKDGNQVDVTNAGVAGVVVHGQYGDLTITGTPGTGYGYSYTLADNTSGDATHEDFAVRVVDSNGDPATATLTIDIVDDAPTANADTDSVTEDVALTADGNVITGVGGGTADVQGADGASVTGVKAGGDTSSAAAGDVGTAVTGDHGSITIGADGHYVYTLNNTDPAVQALSTGDTLTDTFTYTITDNDGDPSTTTVTITINGTNDTPTVSVPQAGAPGTEVSEAGLPAHDGLPAGSASGTDSETTTGSFSYTNGDGASTVTINGVAVAVGATVSGDYGTLTITSIVGTTVSYSYTLAHNVDNDTDLTPYESFTVKVADSDGNPADDASDTFQIQIVDDAPTANDDTVASPITGETILSGLLGNDVFGADGVDTTNSTPGTITATNGAHGDVVYNDNGTFTYTPTGVFVGDDTFTYTITDRDGDTSTATVTVHVNTNTVPTGGGTVSLSVNEAALDTTLDASPVPADLAAGVVTGTDPASRGETDQKTSGITFTATGEDIMVAFANPTGDPAWVAPTITGLAAGYHLEWRLDGGELIGSLIKDVGSVDLGDFVVLSLTNTAAAPGNSVTPTVTATLIDNLLQTAGLGTNDVTINGLQVVATDTSGDHVSGAVNLAVRDDVPTAFTPEQIFSEDVNHAVLSGPLNFASHAGADGVGDVVFNVHEGDAVKDAAGNDVYMNGEQLFYHIVDSHTVQGVSSDADGSDLAFTQVLHPDTGTWDFTLNGTLFNGSEFTTQGASPSGGNVNVVGFNKLTDPDTPNDLLVTANGTNTVNTSTGNFGVGSGQSIGNGETIRFDFVTNESTGNTIGTTTYTNHYEVTSFTQELTKTNGTTSFTIKALNADNDLLFVGDPSGESIAHGIIVTVTNGSGGTAPTATINGDGSWTLSGMDKGDTFTVTATTDPFSAIEITGTGSKTFTLGPATFDTANAVDPFDVMTPIIATDGDGDPQASSVSVTLTPDVHTTQGSSGDDLGLQTTSLITTLLGEDGNDTLTGLDGQVDILAWRVGRGSLQVYGAHRRARSHPRFQYGRG
ncbi:MAG: VCBS domain-containing protein [Rhizobiales bacterium]|nr:VCBS domain-containing protein [Hyphomicrobiales bacterium]